MSRYAWDIVTLGEGVCRAMLSHHLHTWDVVSPGDVVCHLISHMLSISNVLQTRDMTIVIAA